MSNVVKETEKPVSKTTRAKVEKKETVIYIGPTISGVITRNTILNNGPTKLLKELIEKVPVLKEMLVPVENLSKAMNSITQEGSAMNNCYKQAVKELEKIKEGGKKE